MATYARSAGRGRHRRGFWFWLRRLFIALFIVVVLLPVVLTLLYRVVPIPGTPLMLATIFTRGPIQYRWVPLDNMSASLVKAVIASEDQKFCSHYGFDVEAINKAFAYNARGQGLRGASTISQQTAKNLFLPPTRDWLRKGIEAYDTVLIETLWPKWRIMETYLNVAELGPGVFGVEAASRIYFRKPASRITAAEAARLAAVLPSPRNYSVNRPGPYVRQRTGQIQGQMRAVTRDRLDGCVTRYR